MTTHSGSPRSPIPTTGGLESGASSVPCSFDIQAGQDDRSPALQIFSCCTESTHFSSKSSDDNLAGFCNDHPQNSWTNLNHFFMSNQDDAGSQHVASIYSLNLYDDPLDASVFPWSFDGSPSFCDVSLPPTMSSVASAKPTLPSIPHSTYPNRWESGFASYNGFSSPSSAGTPCGLSSAFEFDLDYISSAASPSSRPFFPLTQSPRSGTSAPSSRSSTPSVHSLDSFDLISRETSPTSSMEGDHHNQRRRFPCTIPGCPRRFTSQYTLKVHVEAHKPKPRVSFPCTLGCSERFSRQHDRLRHEVAKHGKVCEFICDECGRFFSTKKTLGNHKCPVAQSGTRWVNNKSNVYD